MVGVYKASDSESNVAFLNSLQKIVAGNKKFAFHVSLKDGGTLFYEHVFKYCVCVFFTKVSMTVLSREHKKYFATTGIYCN